MDRVRLGIVGIGNMGSGHSTLRNDGNEKHPPENFIEFFK